MQFQAILDEPVALPRAGIVHRSDLPPLIIIAAIAALTAILEQWIPLRWNIPAYKLVWPVGISLAIAAFYSMARPRMVVREIGLYLSFWIFFPVFATRLSYFATCTGMPLRDSFFSAADAAIGFHWADWVSFITRYPGVVALQEFAYGSSYWQPLLTVVVLALWGPRGRNGEFLTSILFALCCTIAVYALLPTLGPADLSGQHAYQAEVIQLLRAGSLGPYAYSGIISFPSLHTAMALLYAAAHRGNRVTFLPVLVLNIAMLTAVPYQGDHYLTDMIAGAVVAFLSLMAARRLHRRLAVSPDEAASGPETA